MSPLQLFVIRVNTLRRIVTEGDPTRLLELAGILRQLFLDDHPLVDLANREFHLKIRFVTSPSAEEQAKEDQRRVPSIGPPSFSFTSIKPGADTRTLNKDQFLKHSIFYLHPNTSERGHYYTVRELVLICANKLGAVHYTPPNKDSEEEAWMRSFNEFASMYGSPIAFATLAEIAAVASTALVELYEKACGPLAQKST